MGTTAVLIVVALCCVWASREAIAQRNRPPNIVLIVADDLGYHDVGYHGAEFATPTLDKLAADGVKLENYYVQPICSPTRSQLMSGRYQIHNGLQHNLIWPSQPYGLPLQYPTVANLLKGHGYSTHGIGKWHLGLSKKEYLPLQRGFDTYYGFWGYAEDYYNYWMCDYHHDRSHDKMASADGEQWCGHDLRDNKQPVTDKKGTYSTHLYTEKAVEVVRSAATADKPFFLYLAYQAVHQPLEAPEEYIKPYEHKIKNKNRRKYAGMVSALDEGVKNLTQALREAGLWNNTVLVFTTDNGGDTNKGGNNFPLRGKKHTLWEGGVKGVGFVSSPLLRPEQTGNVTREMMHVSDWFPTLADMAGAKVNSSLGLDGFSQWAMIRDGKPTLRKEILHNIDIWHPLKGNMLFNDTFDTRVRATIRVGDYKLITGDPGPDIWYPVPPEDREEDIPFLSAAADEPDDKNLWLFNIRSDPEERQDLSATMPEMVQTLLHRIAQYNATAAPPLFPDSDPRCDPALRDGFWGPWL